MLMCQEKKKIALCLSTLMVLMTRNETLHLWKWLFNS